MAGRVSKPWSIDVDNLVQHRKETKIQVDNEDEKGMAE
jgi:hypothetical protein